MNEEQYRQVVEIFHEAADLEGEAREAFLDKACKGDGELRRQVELLLGHDEPDDDTLLEKRPEMGHQLLDGMETPGTDFVNKAFPQLPQLDRIGPYRIIEKIGEGGMGTVFLAEQDHPRRRVALKMIRPGLLSPGLLKRFRFEADVLGRLKHPGIAQIFEASEIETDAGPLPYFAMEYVEGVGLKQYVERNDPDVRARLELMARIADAVHHAHQRGIMHRDLKPDNVLVVEATGTTKAGVTHEFARLGQPKILDFGVARATDSDMQVTTLQTDVGQLIGTLTYMSPEQVEGDSSKLDERSDIYALGVILYELLAGRPPLDLRDKSIPEAGRIIREEEPTRLASIHTDFRGDIDTITCKALEKDRERRYPTAQALAADIRRYLANEPIFAHRPSTLYQLKKFTKRHKGLMAGLVLSFLILIAGIIFSLSFAIRATRGEAEARSAGYRLNITAAEAICDTDPLRAMKYLEAVPPEFRQWEWRHLYARLNAQIVEISGSFPQIVCRPDGHLITPRDRDGAVELVEIPSGHVQAVFRAKERLSSARLSPLGTRMVTVAEADKKLILWDTSTRARLTEIPFPAPDSEGTWLSPHGRLILYKTHQEECTALDTTTGMKASLASPRNVFRSAVFDPEKERFVCVAPPNIYLYTYTGECLRVRPYVESPMSLALSPDGKRLAVGETQRMIRIMDASTLEVLFVLAGHSDWVTAVAFSPDGRQLASASPDGTICLWNLDTRQAERTFIGYALGVRPIHLAFFSDGRNLAVGHKSAMRVIALDLDARRVLRGHERYVYRVLFNPDGSLLASAAFYEKARLWDGLTGEPFAEIDTGRPHKNLSFTPDGSRLIISDRPGFLFWDPGAGRPVEAPRTAVDQLLFDPDFDYWAAASPGAKQSSDAGERWVSNPDRTLIAEGTFRTLVKVVAKGRHRHEAGSEEILIRDLATHEILKRMGKFDCGVESVSFSPDGKRLASGLLDGPVIVWDLDTGEELATMKGHTSDVYSIDFSPDGTRIVTGGNDGMIILWDAHTFEQVLVLSGHTSYVHSVRFSPDGSLIASGSGDGTVRLWDSITPAERWRELGKAREKRREAEPLVDRLLKELGDPLDVADRLRADASMSEEERRAALYVLLKRSASISGG